ncbi:YkgJ family cysteine cluster protein [Massilia aquatica]|uniref:YkgJ family cysteine cluster protein n=1 Tax=Massilia aquatica TaxID=2609000 RepID=A0ABX0M4L6_9BURK|nr:YkgJ family cysteine cluster protein [Massilia aquatica]NHZ39993.1 YkgJ family cysteine cluster protein [Massilia aquatica]
MFDLTDDERDRLNSTRESQAKKYRQQLRMTRNKTFAINLVRNLYSQVDTQVVRAKERGLQFDCTSGCNFCCSLRVEVVPPEVFLIARELRKQPKQDFEIQLKKISAQASYANGLNMGRYDRPCALLKDGRCSVYDIRPSMCRKLNSLDVEACRRPGTDAPEDEQMVSNIAAIVVGANEGYGQAKFPNDSHELGQALWVALTDEKAEDRWFSGDTVFQALPDSY